MGLLLLDPVHPRRCRGGGGGGRAGQEGSFAESFSGKRWAGAQETDQPAAPEGCVVHWVTQSLPCFRPLLLQGLTPVSLPWAFWAAPPPLAPPLRAAVRSWGWNPRSSDPALRRPLCRPAALRLHLPSATASTGTPHTSPNGVGEVVYGEGV